MRQPLIIRQLCPIGPSGNIDTDLPKVKPGEMWLIREMALYNPTTTPTNALIKVESASVEFELYQQGNISAGAVANQQLYTLLGEGEHIRITPGHQTTGGALFLMLSGWLFLPEPEVITVTEVKP